MAESETPSALFRKTSFTMRHRLTPARACSTRTRMRPNFRLVRFSAAVNSPLAGFFFRLAGFLHRWFVPLEPAVLVQDRPRRRGDALVVGNALVGCLADVRTAQKIDTHAPRCHHDEVLVAMDLLPATVVRGLCFRVFGPLAATLGAVNDQSSGLPVRGLGSCEGLGITFGQYAHIVEGVAQDRQQAAEPVVDPRL